MKNVVNGIKSPSQAQKPLWALWAKFFGLSILLVFFTSFFFVSCGSSQGITEPGENSSSEGTGNNNLSAVSAANPDPEEAQIRDLSLESLQFGPGIDLLASLRPFTAQDVQNLDRIRQSVGYSDLTKVRFSAPAEGINPFFNEGSSPIVGSRWLRDHTDDGSVNRGHIMNRLDSCARGNVRFHSLRKPEIILGIYAGPSVSSNRLTNQAFEFSLYIQVVQSRLTFEPSRTISRDASRSSPEAIGPSPSSPCGMGYVSELEFGSYFRITQPLVWLETPPASFSETLSRANQQISLHDATPAQVRSMIISFLRLSSNPAFRSALARPEVVHTLPLEQFDLHEPRSLAEQLMIFAQRATGDSPSHALNFMVSRYPQRGTIPSLRHGSTNAPTVRGQRLAR